MSRALECNIRAVNRANAEANRLHPILAEALKPFVGQKIKKVDGELTQKVKAAIPELPYGRELRATLSTTDHSIYCYVTAVEFGENDRSDVRRAYSKSCSFYIGEVRDQVLVNLYDVSTDRPTDYSAKKVTELRKVAERKQQEARDAVSALAPFGEYD